MKKINKKQETSENKTSTWKEFLPLLKTPRGKAFVFFGVYFLFFLMILFLARSQRGDVLGSQYELGSPYSFNIALLSKGNYHYQYSYELDQKLFNYEGDRDNNRQLFSDGVNSFFMNQANCLKRVDGLWIKAENPYVLEQFLDVEVFAQLLAAATYISKTEYDDGRSTINFQITTNTLVKQLEGVIIDLDAPVNEIIVSTDAKKNITQIKYQLTDYCKYKQLVTEHASLTLNYSNFGNVEEIKDPQ